MLHVCSECMRTCDTGAHCVGWQGPHLVIAPKSTLTNWYKEFTRWCPSLRAFQFQGNKEARAGLKEKYLEQPASFDVCLTTFDMVIAEKSALNKLVWRYLVIDEAHRIKNEQSVLAQVVRLFSVHFRLLITGTPLQVREAPSSAHQAFLPNLELLQILAEQFA